MHRKSIIIIAAIILFATVYQTFADYYVIRLNNGKEIAVQKYWDEGPKIRFYRDGGSVAIPKGDIKAIEKQGGTPAAVPSGADAAALPGIAETEGAQNPTPSPTPPAKAKENEQAEIKERLDIIQSNIATLNERNKSYLNQKNAAQEVKVKAEERIGKYRADTYMTSEDRKQSIAREERKINDAEINIMEADRQIGSLEEMIGNQEAIRKNLEDKLRQQ
ncbi:MAG: hypothetical protein NTV89_16325 [Proteobacteria bacterium]|nr:hypothetical protein [Pseudomonadota bacterium]